MGNPVYTAVRAEHITDPTIEVPLDLRWTRNHSTDELRREQVPGEHRFCERAEDTTRTNTDDRSRTHGFRGLIPVPG